VSSAEPQGGAARLLPMPTRITRDHPSVRRA
jgi:hypothetical protein